KFASYGSLGMGAGTLVAGIIGIYWQVFLLGSLLFVIAFIMALTLEESKKQIIHVPLFPKKVLKENLAVYSAFFLRHTGASAVWIIFPVYLSILGASKAWIGAIYALNALSQFVFMQLIDKFKSSKLVATGLISSGITFISFFLVQNFYHIFLLQLLLGFSWACLYTGSLKFVTERTLEKATSVGLLNSALSISIVLGPFLGGALAQVLGYRNVILFAVAMCFIALSMFRVAKRY
ncbi:MAG: MFS transporter, partial [Candidatus Thermoplasmatota archaeon]|nr:MFS transporter [Candidatus Thermoplasmatota archaeon]